MMHLISSVFYFMISTSVVTDEVKDIVNRSDCSKLANNVRYYLEPYGFLESYVEVIECNESYRNVIVMFHQPTLITTLRIESWIG